MGNYSHNYIFLKRLKNAMDGDFVDPYVEQRIQYINELYNLTLRKEKEHGYSQLDQIRQHVGRGLGEDLNNPEILKG